ncbi:hypothetical protein PENTCL1PPCAC_12878, partial [Pristionchus entomophagus]
MLPRKPDREENNEAASKCRAYDVQAIIIGAKYKDSFIRMKKEYLDVLNQNASHLDFLIENDRFFDSAQRTLYYRKLLSANSDANNALLRE